MKIYIPKFDNSKIGGGWSFTRDFIELADKYLVSSLDEADIFFITAPTLVSRDEMQRARELGKKIVLRVDGVPEDARNRGTGWPRLRDYAFFSDLVIYQSDFIKKTVGRLLDVQRGVVIYNGINTNIFKPNRKEMERFRVKDSILYINYRKAEQNKRVEEVIERFRYLKIDKPNTIITFVGLYPKIITDWNFWMLDYERDKDWRYLGVISDKIKLANIMRSHEFIAFPSFADPCPNTLIEAVSCGCKPLWINEYGGQADIIANWNKFDWSRERMVNEYLFHMEKL